MKDQAPTSTGCMFWALAPFLIIFMVTFPLLVHPRSAPAVILLCGLELFCLLAFLGLLSPVRFWWALRGVGMLIFLAYASYLVDELIESKGTTTVRRSMSEPSVFNALAGLIVFGLPGLAYAIFGQFTLRRKETADDGPTDESEDEDSSP